MIIIQFPRFHTPLTYYDRLYEYNSKFNLGSCDIVSCSRLLRHIVRGCGTLRRSTSRQKRGSPDPSSYGTWNRVGHSQPPIGTILMVEHLLLLLHIVQHDALLRDLLLLR